VGEDDPTCNMSDREFIVELNKGKIYIGKLVDKEYLGKIRRQ